MVGEFVLFDGEKYIIKYRYTSDYCEIQEADNPFRIKLVHISEVINIDK